MNKNLALYFTFGMSLEKWVSTGLFFREKLLYEKHLNACNFRKIFWITYGLNDQKLAKKLKSDGKLHSDIEVLDVPHFFKFIPFTNLIYSFLVPIIYYFRLRNVQIHKSNQMAGAWSPCFASFITGNSFYLRTGYTYSKFLGAEERHFKMLLYSIIEFTLYQFADFSAVSSLEDAEYISQQYQHKPLVLRNYIDRDIFKDHSQGRKNEFIFVGRFNKQKNLEYTVNLLHSLNLPLTLIGDGEEKETLRKLSSRPGSKIKLLGKIDNNEIPTFLNSFKYYIQLSYYEGMPKTLIEALACGCICIASQVPGSKEVIIPNVNGFLIDHTDIRKGSAQLSKIVRNDQSQVLKNAVTFVDEHFSINAISYLEASYLIR